MSDEEAGLTRRQAIAATTGTGLAAIFGAAIASRHAAAQPKGEIVDSPTLEAAAKPKQEGEKIEVASDWKIIDGDLLIQWGVAISSTQRSVIDVRFPKPFSSTPSLTYSRYGSRDEREAYEGKLTTLSATHARITTPFRPIDSADGITWIAIGRPKAE